MITALLITILPTLLIYILLRKTKLAITSNYLRISISWFTGMYLFSFLTFFLANLLSYAFTSVLTIATFISLFVVEIILCFFLKDIFYFYTRIKQALKRGELFTKFDVTIIASCFLFVFFFFSPHLLMQNEKIFTTHIYWDFRWHAAIIQNFVYGDNFPPQNESFSAIPLTYHFFGDFVMSMYQASGLSITDAVTFTSILVFFFLLMTIIGICQEFFASKLVGVIAVVLTLTSSSKHFLYFLDSMQGKSIFEIVGSILSNTQHPWYASFIEGNPAGYAGIMFNLFYYLQERHMIFGFIYLLICLWIIYKRKELSNKILFILGCVMGTFFFWHLYIPVLVILTLLFVLLFDNEKKKTLMLVSGFCIVFGAQYLYLKYLISHSSWFDATKSVHPQWNINFAVQNHGNTIEIISSRIFQYFSFSYGLKFFLLPIALIYLWRKNKKVGVILAGLILPTFILINTFQISPVDIGDNHKILLPMTIVVNLAVALIIFRIFFKKKSYFLYYIGALCLLFLTLSGIIELMPFLNAKPTELYVNYSASSLTKTIQRNTAPRTSFVGKDDREIHLAGRKLFVGESAGATKSFNKSVRKKIISEIYNTTDVQMFCRLTQKYDIDFVEYDRKKHPLKNDYFLRLPHFVARDWEHENVIFIDTKKACRK